MTDSILQDSLRAVRPVWGIVRDKNGHARYAMLYKSVWELRNAARKEADLNRGTVTEADPQSVEDRYMVLDADLGSGRESPSHVSDIMFATIPFVWPLEDSLEKQ